MEDGTDAGLLGIGLSDSDEAAAAGIAENGDITQPSSARNAQSEEEFQAVRKAYRVKLENGEAWRNIKLPLSEQVTKPEAQALLHAVEELYFFRRYDEGVDFTRKVLGSKSLLDKDTKNLLQYYLKRCQDKTRLVKNIPID